MLSKHQIHEICQEIWESLLGMDLEMSEEAGDPFADCKRTFTGFVNIGGAWQGTVLLEVSDTLSHRFGGQMLGIPADEVTSQDVGDSLGELTNMVGGNIKSLLPSPSNLSIPSVAEGSDYSISAPGTDLLAQLTLRCEGEPMLITVRQALMAG
ncbi:MAG: chemotaxis protein CheX [Frankiaceae bacterium]|jgi:chemotaxis protein CheX|nr:chemotaxis protein CheX [Frankiaceae bacterium]